MHFSIDEIKNRIKAKRNGQMVKEKRAQSNYIKTLFTRVLLAVIFFLLSVIYMNYSNQNLLTYKKYVLDTNFNFAKVNTVYKNLFGSPIPLDNLVDSSSIPVFNENLSYTDSVEYLNGLKLSVANNYAVPILESGIVVFVGEKEGYKNTVIIQGIDGVDIWYGNIININVSLYDYVEAKSLLGEVNDNEMYLVLQKDGNYIKYENYKK